MEILQKLTNNNISTKKKTKFILSFIGTLLYGFGGLTTMGIGQYNVYITSYFYHNKVNIDMQYGNLIMPIIMLSNSIFSPLAGYMENKIGLYLSLALSSILIELGVILFINQISISFSLILIIFLGFSSGIGMSFPGKNLYYYYPKRGGFLGSVMGSCFIIISTIMGVVGEKIINPEKYTLKKGEQFYPLQISQNYKKYFKYILFINPFTLILALLLIKKYNPELDKESNEENNNINENNMKKNKIKKDENYSKNIKMAVLDKRIWRIIGINIFTPFVIGFSRITFRVYGALASISGAVMQYSIFFTGFSNVIVGPIWGYISDKYSYEILMKIICSCCIFHALILSILIKSNTIYLICIFLGSIIISGFFASSRLHILKVYGIKYSLEISGIIGIFGGIFNILNSSLSLIISKFYHKGEELQVAYRYVYIIGILISGIGFYLSIHEKDDEFQYLFSPKQSEYLTMINIDSKETKDKNINSNENNFSEDKEIELEMEINTSNSTEDKLD